MMLKEGPVPHLPISFRFIRHTCYHQSTFSVSKSTTAQRRCCLQPLLAAAAAARCRRLQHGRLLLFVASQSMRQMPFKSSHLSASRDQHDHSLLRTAWWHDHPHSNIAYHLPAPLLPPIEFVRPIYSHHVSRSARAPRVARPALFPARNHTAVQVLHHDRARLHHAGQPLNWRR